MRHAACTPQAPGCFAQRLLESAQRFPMLGMGTKNVRPPFGSAKSCIVVNGFAQTVRHKNFPSVGHARVQIT